MILRPNQSYALEEIPRRIAEGHRRICITSPTGGGKSLIMFERIEHSGLPTTVYTDRRMLFKQLKDGLESHGIPHGLRAAKLGTKLLADIQLSMTQTEVSRSLKGKREIHAAKQVLIDEAHKQSGDSMLQLLDMHRDAQAELVTLGFTATPLGIGHAYDTLIVAGTNSELRGYGALVPAFTYGPNEPDTKWIGKIAIGEGECGLPNNKRMEFAQRVFGNMVETYRELNAEGRPTILFAPGVAESKWCAMELCANGIAAAHIDGDSIWVDGEDRPSDEEGLRDNIRDRLQRGDLKVVCNRFVLREGIDWPFVSHGIFLTVFGSLTSYLQAGGRLLRACEGKESACIARGTPILTDRGLVPIQEVTTNDLVWDGVEFCCHDGATCNGVMPVIELGGMQLTPDHEVLTNDGWKQAQEAKSGRWKPVIGGIGRMPIRTIDHSNPHDSRKSRQARGASRLLAMRSTRVEVLSQNFEASSSWLRALHGEIRGSLPGMALATRSSSATEVRMPAEQYVPSLWRTRNRISLLFDIRGGLLDCQAHWDSEEKVDDLRSHRQRWALRAGKSTVGNPADAVKKSGLRMAHTTKEVIPICDVFGRQFIATPQERTKPEADSGLLAVEVWDILNVGPRNRYCANGRIVANCVQDHGGNWWRHGSLNSDREWDLTYTDRIVAGLREQRLREKKESEPIVCPKCFAIRLSGAECYKCGFKHDKKVRMVVQQDGSLREMKGDIFRARRLATPTEQLEKEWVSRVNAIRHSKKETVKRMTFSQLEATFARDHNWAYPPHSLPSMPTRESDWFRPVASVPQHELSK